MIDRKQKKINDKELAQSIFNQLKEMHKGTEFEKCYNHIALIENKNKCYNLKYLQHIAAKLDKKIIIKFVDINK